MDVGSEISEKIQLAIKAKLKEINAYVDDELPDYIMIMIANRKPEEQMCEALSLFLGDHAKNFTKWLFELLSGLREKSAAKKEVQNEVSKSTKSSERGEITVIIPKDKSSLTKSSDSSKPSRWDVKKHAKRKSSAATESDIVVTEKTSKSNSAKEAIIDILPEKNDLFDEELLTELEEGANNVSAKSISVNNTKTQKNDEKSVKSVKLVPSISHDKDKSRTLKKVADLSPERKDKNATDVNKSIKEHTKKAESSNKRTVSVKSSKDSSQKAFAVDNEVTSHSLTSKSKKKKLKRSHERDHVPSHKSKVTKNSPKYSREWDKGKGQESLKYNDSQPKLKKSDYSEKKGSLNTKSKLSSQVSSTVVVAKPEVYESEDSDENSISTAVISKVSVPKRRSRLPPSKQANRSLLLKAVSEAESSIKKHCLVNKIIEPISEEVFKTKVEKHKRIALGEVLEKNKRVQIHESSKRSISSRLLRDSNLLKSTSDSGKTEQISKSKQLFTKKRKLVQEDGVKSEDSTRKLVNEKRKSTVILENKLQIPTDTRQHFGDSRRIVSRDKKTPEKLAKRPDSKVESAMQKTTRQQSIFYDKGSDDEEEDKSSGVVSSQDEVSPKRSKRNRSPSPCFIVTLDGSSKSNIKSSKLPEHKTLVTTDKSKQLKAALISSPTPLDKPSSVNKLDDSALSENELTNMKKKLLAMQEQAKKLKEIQAKQHELLMKRKQNNGHFKLENKTIHLANVHFSATEKQISEHFSICGKVTKVSILKDQFSGHSKG